MAYFFLQRHQDFGRSFGYLATNTIAQGDTSEVGLTQIIDTGWKIHRAISSTTWPGDATLEIAKVWATAHPWSGQHVLDGRPVAGIDEMLHPLSRSEWRKQRLAANTDKSFQGSIVLGMGFTMSPEEAQALINKDPNNADVLRPYLGGENLNQSPTHTAPRWIINFFDWPEEKARQYPDCFTIVEEKVKPERQERKAERRVQEAEGSLQQRYWMYADNDVQSCTGRSLCWRVSLVITLKSQQVGPARASFPTSQVLLTRRLGIFAYDDDFHFGVLTSGFHYRWAVRHGSTLETRVRYTPSDVFETFAQPLQNDVVASAGSDSRCPPFKVDGPSAGWG